MSRQSARAVLARMMDEIARQDIPSEQTWADACRILGRPVPVPLANLAGKTLHGDEALAAIMNPRKAEAPV